MHKLLREIKLELTVLKLKVNVIEREEYLKRLKIIETKINELETNYKEEEEPAP